MSLEQRTPVPILALNPAWCYQCCKIAGLDRCRTLEGTNWVEVLLEKFWKVAARKAKGEIGGA
jgi:hypothetical protein